MDSCSQIEARNLYTENAEHSSCDKRLDIMTGNRRGFKGKCHCGKEATRSAGISIAMFSTQFAGIDPSGSCGFACPSTTKQSIASRHGPIGAFLGWTSGP